MDGKELSCIIVCEAALSEKPFIVTAICNGAFCDWSERSSTSKFPADANSLNESIIREMTSSSSSEIFYL